MVKFPMLLKAVNGLFNIFYVLIILRIFMSWIPSIDWEQQPVKFVRIVTDSYLTVFQRFVPPLGGLDFSPIIAIIVLQILQGIITSAIGNL
ncbi:MAG: YggT family protein [Candidatus Gastranaerophilaceae bacterium]